MEQKKDERIVDAETVEVSNLPAVQTVRNSAGQEIVVYGQNGEIVDCYFQRVDFNTPSTILSYCDDVKNSISAILDSTAQMAIDSQEIRIDEEMLRNITSFDESLDESERKKEKQDNLPAIIKGARGLLAKIGVKKFEEVSEEETTYKGRYRKYCRGLEEVAAAVESQKQAALNEINLRNDIIAEITPYIEILEEMIKVGEIDRATFDATIEELKKLPQDQDTQYEIQYKTQLSEVFNGKLDKLSRALVALKGQVQGYRLQNNTDMTAVMEHTSYISDVAPILKAQGSLVVFNRQQENRLNDLALLNQASNQAIANNARDLEQNAASAVELSVHGGITVETLKSVKDAAQRGFAIVQKGRKEQQQQIAKNKVALAELNAALSDFQQELLQLADDNSVREELLKSSSSTNGYGAPVKKLGTKKGSKK